MRFVRKIRTGINSGGVFAVLVLAFSLLGIATGCSNLTGQPPTQTKGGQVLIQLAHASAEDDSAASPSVAARTLLPTVAGLYYTLEFTDPSDTTPTEGAGTLVKAVLSSGVSITVPLNAITWDLEVKGYLSQQDAENTPEAPVVAGNAQVAVAADAITPVTVKLDAASSAIVPGKYGSLRYTVTFPNSPAVTKAVLTVDTYVGSNPVTTIDLLSAGSINTTSTSGSGVNQTRTSTGLIDLETGYYWVSINLYNGKTMVDGDLAHIYEDLVSQAAFTYTAANFADAADTTALLDDIKSAGDAKAGVRISANGDGIPAGISWVTQAVWDALNSAIAAAQLAVDSAATQTEVNTASIDLQAAITAFTNALGGLPTGAGGVGTYNPSTDSTIPYPGLYIGGDETAGTHQTGTGTLALALAWLQDPANATDVVDDGEYTILLGADENLSPWTLGGVAGDAGDTLALNGRTGVKLTLKGKYTERTVQLVNGPGSLLTVRAGVTLILDENITLRGTNTNTAPLVLVNNAGKLELKDGAKITGNYNNTGGGGGMFLDDAGSSITISGGEIFGNTATLGGGICFGNGTLTMSGGKISGNKTTNNSDYGGGGVYLGGSNKTLIMSGGEISDNTAAYSGGGVYFYSGGTLTMSGTAAISGNTGSGSWSSAGGGGVCFYSSGGTLTMSGTAAISGNTSSGSGGGVNFPSSGGTLTMNDTAAISGNTAGGNGGGVWRGTIAMNGHSVISGNTTSGNGGGVNAEVTMNDYAAIADNTAANGGGVDIIGTLTMSSTAVIAGNRASANGGGVYVNGNNNTLALSAGTISGNTANNGGGVYVNAGRINKTGGVINGDTNTTHHTNETTNTTTSGKGHALSIAGVAMRNGNIESEDHIDVMYFSNGNADYLPALTDPFWDTN
jgi:hypothetical protein